MNMEKVNNTTQIKEVTKMKITHIEFTNMFDSYSVSVVGESGGSIGETQRFNTRSDAFKYAIGKAQDYGVKIRSTDSVEKERLAKKSL